MRWTALSQVKRIREEVSRRPGTPPCQTGFAPLRTYPAPWKGHLLLACRKCQKKLKRSDSSCKVANLKRSLKNHPQAAELRLRVLQVPCLKLCPKGGVTVCTQHQIAGSQCSILRTSADLDSLYTQCLNEAATRLPHPEA